MTSPTNPINQAYELPNLPPNTVVPTDEELFVPYFSRLYEDIANIVNSKDDNYFPIAITSQYTNIPVLPNFGAFIVCVSGTNSTLPTITASLTKSDATAAGVAVTLGSQAGTGAWAGFVLSFNAGATNFQIKHNNTGVPGNFNIKIVGTQG